MAITLGTHAFDARTTAVREKQAETGGRDAREIRLSGVLAGADTGIEAELDAIVASAGDGDTEAVLMLRAGRQLIVRRIAFTREVARDLRTASFVLDLEARDPYETSVDIHSFSWAATASGDTLPLTSSGNVHSQPVITLVASGDVIRPAFGDGERTLTYDGTVPDGESLILDAEQGRVWLSGEEVTPYTEGVLPRIGPGATTLTYHDDVASSHTAQVTVAYRDRWW